MMRTIFLLSAFSLSAFLFTGCSSSGGNKPTPTTNTWNNWPPHPWETSQ